MKSILLLLVLAGLAVSLQGCATPAYSFDERMQIIGRGWNYDGEQIADDIDHVLLLRPASRMTIWDEYHRD